MLKKSTQVLLGTTLALAVGATAFAPAVYAAGNNSDGARQHHKGERGHGKRFGPSRGNPLFAALCGDDAADKRSEMFDQFEEKIKPTGDQTALWDALKSTVTTAGTDFSESCDAIKSTETETAPENMAKRMAMMEARLAFSGAVLPAFESFYDSLTEDQIAELKMHPEGRGRSGHRGHQGSHDGKRGGPRSSN